MNNFKNLTDFPTEVLILLHIYDMERKGEITTFVRRNELDDKDSLIIDELNVNIKNISVSNPPKNAFTSLDSAISNRTWGFWIDSFDFLYIGQINSLL